MSEQIITKRCFTCKQTKPISEFYKRSDSKDGYGTDCKSCCREYNNKYRKTERGKMICRLCRRRYIKSEKGKIVAIRGAKQSKKRYPERIIARYALNNAIAAGKLARANTLQCSCGQQADQYHHYKGYATEHWLDVIPMCIKCHNLLHC